MKPCVSVLLPYREAGPWLDRAIASIQTQTFKDWELLLIDNASTDGGPAIAREWSVRDPRIRLLHEPGPGIAHALNTGLLNAGGDLIGRMDADDECRPERLQRQVAFMNAHPEVGVLGTRT
ncbi:MAG: glycosyltransferase family 2 protein, partial [Flavobacteriales bacterium]|nr:glycosyltransferase family 2 protein [Flavobacteriales bacterium]